MRRKIVKEGCRGDPQETYKEMEGRRRTRSQGPPTPAENNELIQWDSIQDTVRMERGRTETHRLERQTNIASNTMENRTENNKISQDQYGNELEGEQRTARTPTTSEIPPLENTGSQTGEIPPNEQRIGNNGSQPGEILPEKQEWADTGVQSGEIPPKQRNGYQNLPSPRISEIPRQKEQLLNANEPMATEEGGRTSSSGEVDQRGSPQIDTAEHYLDDNFSDVMRSSAIGSNISSLFNTTAFNTTNNEHKVTLDWIIPDGRNSRLETLHEKHIMNFPAPGGKTGAMLVHLPDLEPFYNMKEFLIDLQSGELFVKLYNK